MCKMHQAKMSQFKEVKRAPANLRIQRLDDMKKLKGFASLGYDESIVFARNIRRTLKKKIGRTLLDSGLVAKHWQRDPNKGYPKNFKNYMTYGHHLYLKDVLKKESLQHIKIIGTMLVSRGGGILYYSVPNLLRWCDWILIMLDNEDKYSRKLIQGFHKKFPGRIRIANSGFPSLAKEKENVPGALLQRLKDLQGPIRETVFNYLRTISKTEKIDLLIYPDSDEIFGDYFEKLLLNFWGMPDKKGIKMRCVWPFGDFKTIGITKMCSHVRVFKYTPAITTVPWRHDWLRNPTPFSRKEFLRDEFTLIHLSHLTDEIRQWRGKYWRSFPEESRSLWRLEKDVRETSSEEIKNKLKQPSDLTIGDYLKIYGKNFNY